jgi:hypothetical protein
MWAKLLRYEVDISPVFASSFRSRLYILCGNRTLFALTITAINLLEMLNWQNFTVIDNTWPKVKNSITINNKVCR